MPKTNKNTPLYFQLYKRIRSMIHEGTLPKDSKLQSIRQAALRHGVSTTTMEHAYNQLLIEGYIRSEPKKGYFVESYTPPFKQAPINVLRKEEKDAVPENLAQSETMFDTERFRKIMNEVLSNDTRIYKPCLPTGEWPLKEAIADHLRTSRDVIAHPGNIVVASGIQQLIVELGTLFEKEPVVAYLRPGFKRALDAFKRQGFTLAGYENLETLLASSPKIIYLSPSNQYPSGRVMPINERLEIIRYAKKKDAIVLEDDYNHLFRYNAYQIPTLHSLSSGKRVVYIGSFSRNTLVSLRMSYMVLPDPLLERFETETFSQTVSKPEQLTMARFIREGHYQKHLKRLSRLSKRKNDALKKALEPFMDHPRFTLYGLESNMHFVVRLSRRSDKDALLGTLKAKGYGYRTFEELPMDVLIPYSGISESNMDQAIQSILGTLQAVHLS
ncbi:MAG: PLP-dependent aminotransferase family protein [Bacillota bacterium]